MQDLDDDKTVVLYHLSDQPTALHDLRHLTSLIAAGEPGEAGLPTEIDLTELGADPVLLSPTEPARRRPLVSLGLSLLLLALALPPLLYLASLAL
ncbi:MAG TPA: hypothetical protein ENK18_11215 [Deltaproteobacteria bacterium]|nr:hypothetical protein [Deltaproteobacteria bacterium]